MPQPRVRHHTNDLGLEGIQNDRAIHAYRGWRNYPKGVHVEVEPFGSPRPGLGGPKDEMSCHAEGAFVEFDAPEGMIPYHCGNRNTALIVVNHQAQFSIDGLNPLFVKVRRHWWEFWRTKANRSRGVE